MKKPTCKRREGTRTASKDKDGEECGRRERRDGDEREKERQWRERGEGRERKCSRPYRLHF